MFRSTWTALMRLVLTVEEPEIMGSLALTISTSTSERFISKIQPNPRHEASVDESQFSIPTLLGGALLFISNSASGRISAQVSQHPHFCSISPERGMTALHNFNELRYTRLRTQQYSSLAPTAVNQFGRAVCSYNACTILSSGRDFFPPFVYGFHDSSIYSVSECFRQSLRRWQALKGCLPMPAKMYEGVS